MPLHIDEMNEREDAHKDFDIVLEPNEQEWDQFFIGKSIQLTAKQSNSMAIRKYQVKESRDL